MKKPLKVKFNDHLGVTYDKIAEVAGLGGKQAIGNWVANNSMPAHAAVKISNHFKISLDWLFDNDANSPMVKIGNNKGADKGLVPGEEIAYIEECLKRLDQNNETHKVLLETLYGVVRLAFDDEANVTNDYIERSPCRRSPSSKLRKSNRRKQPQNTSYEA